MRVYKFLESKWAKEAIVNSKIKISLLNTLNDPWELHAVRFPNAVEQRPLWNKVVSLISQSNGVVCFSRSWDDPVHWSHYGDQHKGIALGFDVVETLDGERVCIPVNYTDKLLDFPQNFFSQIKNSKEDEQFVQRVIATKYANWSYEDEVRYYTKLDEADDHGNFFLHFDQNVALREVIFGERYNNPSEMAHILACLRRLEDIDCWRAARDNSSFRLTRDPSWSFFRPQQHK